MKLNTYTIAALIIIAILTASGAGAQNWNSTLTAGLTSVTWNLTGATYTWTLTNNSGSDYDGQPDYDILIWSLQPFGVPLPTAWTAPDGWEWGGVGFQSFRLVNDGEKYSSPPAVAPGGWVIFTYTFDPGAPMANSQGPQPGNMAFISHVGAVRTVPATTDGATTWIPASNPELGGGWYDAAAGSEQQSPQAPEPSGILICLMGGAWLATHLIRNGKRLADGRNSIFG